MKFQSTLEPQGVATSPSPVIPDGRIDDVAPSSLRHSKLVNLFFDSPDPPGHLSQKDLSSIRLTKMAPAPQLLDSSTETVASDAEVNLCMMKLGNHPEIAGEETESWSGSE